MINSVIKLTETHRIIINSSTEILLRKDTRGVIYDETKATEVWKVYFSLDGFDIITDVNESIFKKIVTEL